VKGKGLKDKNFRLLPFTSTYLTKKEKYMRKIKKIFAFAPRAI